MSASHLNWIFLLRLPVPAPHPRPKVVARRGGEGFRACRELFPSDTVVVRSHRHRLSAYPAEKMGHQVDLEQQKLEGYRRARPCPAV